MPTARQAPSRCRQCDPHPHRGQDAAATCWSSRSASPDGAGHRPRAGTPLAGVYVGEAGVSVALLRARQVLADDTVIAAASTRGNGMATLPFTSPDLMNGTAGRLRFHLLLCDATGKAEHLGHAVDAVEQLRLSPNRASLR
jgi:hypothetical protein